MKSTFGLPPLATPEMFKKTWDAMFSKITKNKQLSNQEIKQVFLDSFPRMTWEVDLEKDCQTIIARFVKINNKITDLKSTDPQKASYQIMYEAIKTTCYGSTRHTCPRHSCISMDRFWALLKKYGYKDKVK